MSAEATEILIAVLTYAASVITTLIIIVVFWLKLNSNIDGMKTDLAEIKDIIIKWSPAD